MRKSIWKLERRGPFKRKDRKSKPGFERTTFHQFSVAEAVRQAEQEADEDIVAEFIDGLSRSLCAGLTYDHTPEFGMFVRGNFIMEG